MPKDTSASAAEAGQTESDMAPAGGQRSHRKSRVGVVVSDRSRKTVTVTVERRVSHSVYGKQVSRTKKYHAHDEGNEYRVGDLVRIVETRPLSKTKRWRVAELLERPE